MPQNPVPVQKLLPPPYSYYKAPYPILSFLYGLYCDAAWSDAEFEKWEHSETASEVYEYEGYLDRYPHLPHGARLLISVRVPEEATEVGGRLLPTRALAKDLLPYLLQELTFDRTQAVSPPSDPERHLPTIDSNRPVLSALAMIYLNDLNESEAQQAFGAYPTALKQKLVAVAAALPSLGAPLKAALQSLKEDVIDDFTTAPGPW